MKSRPVRVRIPAIDVNSSLVGLGLKGDGTMETPQGGFPAGWYTGAPTPGELGPAIIAGHVHWWDGPGVFYDLDELSAKDKVIVRRKDGSVATFRVTRVREFSKRRFPTDAVYGNIPHPGLRLITCGGLDPETRTYEENVVVFAKLVASPHRGPGGGSPARSSGTTRHSGGSAGVSARQGARHCGASQPSIT
ncbi:MAG: class F sortase [Actinomycetes bacterium]